MPLYLKDKLVSGTGAPGKSAYEAAKTGGYTGTEASFNQALKEVPAHIADTENPHNVTATQVGAYSKAESDTLLANKAPAGYGLGEMVGETILDCNSADKFGIYATSSSTSNAPTSYGTLFVIPRYMSSELQSTVQIYFPATSSGSSNISDRCYLIREREQSGTWKDWEWVNPPFITDTVYRTIERQFDNPVYKKMDSNGVIWWSTDQSTWKCEAERVGAYSKTETDALFQYNDPRQWGLGKDGIPIINKAALDGLFTPGWYMFYDTSNTLDHSIRVGLVEVKGRNASITACCVQEIWTDDFTGGGGLPYKAERMWNGSKWGPFEWFTPPMIPGNEYRTTERFFSEPVYVQVFTFYPWPADGSITSLNIEGINRIVSAEVSTGIGVIGPGKTTSRMGFDVALAQNYIGGTDATWNGAIKTYGSNPDGGANYLKIYYTKGS